MKKVYVERSTPTVYARSPKGSKGEYGIYWIPYQKTSFFNISEVEYARLASPQAVCVKCGHKAAYFPSIAHHYQRESKYSLRPRIEAEFPLSVCTLCRVLVEKELWFKSL
jgi:hypothetical protein